MGRRKKVTILLAVIVILAVGLVIGIVYSKNNSQAKNEHFVKCYRNEKGVLITEEEYQELSYVLTKEEIAVLSQSYKDIYLANTDSCAPVFIYDEDEVQEGETMTDSGFVYQNESDALEVYYNFSPKEVSYAHISLPRDEAIRRAKEEVNIEYDTIKAAYGKEIWRISFHKEGKEQYQYVYIGFDGLTKRMVTTTSNHREQSYYPLSNEVPDKIHKVSFDVQVPVEEKEKSESYYTNEAGVTFSEEEYQKLSYIFTEHALAIMQQDFKNLLVKSEPYDTPCFEYNKESDKVKEGELLREDGFIYENLSQAAHAVPIDMGEITPTIATLAISKEEAVVRAKEEASISYDTVKIARDMDNEMWRISFYQKGEEQYQYVYIGFDGLTKRMVTTTSDVREITNNLW